MEATPAPVSILTAPGLFVFAAGAAPGASSPLESRAPLRRPPGNRTSRFIHKDGAQSKICPPSQPAISAALVSDGAAVVNPGGFAVAPAAAPPASLTAALLAAPAAALDAAPVQSWASSCFARCCPPPSCKCLRTVPATSAPAPLSVEEASHAEANLAEGAGKAAAGRSSASGSCHEVASIHAVRKEVHSRLERGEDGAMSSLDSRMQGLSAQYFQDESDLSCGSTATSSRIPSLQAFPLLFVFSFPGILSIPQYRGTSLIRNPH